jgi:glycerophosphoryl diester phosphodiesterase
VEEGDGANEKGLRIPKIIGHRGAKASAPENTLAAIRQAHLEGAKWVELDVMLTKDKQPVIIHDDKLDRVSNGTGNVDDLTLEELRKFDFGSWFDPKFAGEQIPTLKEAVDLIHELGLGFNLELKPYNTERAVETATVVCTWIKNHWKHGDLLISSFVPDCLMVAKAIVPNIPRGGLIYDQPPQWKEIADALGVYSLNVENTRQTKENVADLLSTGRPVIVYTVNDATRAKELFEWGVSSIFTDCPGAIKKALGL